MGRKIKESFKGKALIPYITIGYPGLEATLKLVPQFELWGADLIELGIPFSDPLADGVTIQEASYLALKNGVKVKTCLEIAAKLREKVSVPLVFMSYYNPVFSFGLDSFCGESARAGIDGLIIPDLIPEEGEGLEEISRSYGLDLIYLLAPNSPYRRIRLVAEHSRSFIYLVSLTGVTGPRERLPDELEGFVLRVRAQTSLPLVVGFGISSEEQARRAAKVADGIVVGSHLIRLIKEDPSYQKLGRFLTSLRSALNY